ncbi:DUF433 domain-containing protein [Thermococcus sp.]|uniref:DUF433 domain-containing protein n=1 Tax=Thermococcus sp. TaxID=35749 RepID=UPI00262188E3|nr:DUF433 domain-containing protein [Thermococcus sp.]
MNMMIDDRIEINPKKMGGKPVIRGTRIPVYFILELLANGWSFEEILESYPQLTKEDILAAIRYASMILKEEQYVEVSG